jgi:hypothetical protein
MTCRFVVFAASLLSLGSWRAQSYSFHCAARTLRSYFSENICHRSTMPSRTVTKSVLSVWQDEGVGARVRRSIGRHEVTYSFLCDLQEFRAFDICINLYVVDLNL